MAFTPITNRHKKTPIYKPSGEETFVTQYSLNYLEDIDLIKFDFLGLKTLDVIDNAIKYTPQGGITVYLERLKDSIRISVKDTGIGISAENLKNLFQKFSRAANAGKVNVTGSGLGLFVAVEIMKAHGGLLSAESDGEGKGSTFIIELPLTKN